MSRAPTRFSRLGSDASEDAKARYEAGEGPGYRKGREEAAAGPPVRALPPPEIAGVDRRWEWCQGYLRGHREVAGGGR